MSPTLENIIVKYITNQASVSEMEQLAKWLEVKSNREIFKNYIKTNYLIDYSSKQFNVERTKRQLFTIIKEDKRVLKIQYYRNALKYAAAVLILTVLSTYFLKEDIFTKDVENDTPIIVNNTIKSGSDKATLTLENGIEVVLEKGRSYTQDNISSDGQELIYSSRNETAQVTSYNYLTIPTGGQFNVILNDGTQVWLNSESKLKYPKHFIAGETRQVELIYGEAYFEVSPSSQNAGAKFKVLTGGQELEVLGTQFNIKAYQEEDFIYTTLIEGRVGIQYENRSDILSPSQQYSLNKTTNTVEIVLVEDMYSITAWKVGAFSFNDMPLNEIMKVLSRWYDTDVVFTNSEIGNTKFNGVLGKEQDIQEILFTIYTTNNVLYEINDKTIIFK